MNFFKTFMLNMVKEMSTVMVQAAFAQAVADATAEIDKSTTLKPEEKAFAKQGIALLQLRAASKLAGALNAKA